MYTKKEFIKIVSYIIFCLYTLFIISILTSKAESKIFKINEIEISEPFGVNFNKDKVINKAFLSAFDELISTIITTKDKLKIKGVNLKEIKFLIDSFEIKDENFVNQKYIANFNVNFDKKKTLNFFEKRSIFPSLNKTKDFITILIFLDNDKNQIYLYENNPFYINWNASKKKYFLLNYILIEEDIENLKIINENKENIENYQFNKIIKKYDLNDYIISIFFKNKSELKVLSKFYFDNNLKITNHKYENIDLENQNKLNDLILKTKIKLEDLWKSKNLINTSIKLPINLQINPKNTSEMVKLEKEIDNIDLVYDYYVTKINSKELNYKIIFNGSPKKFLQIMNEKNFDIDIDNEIWKIK